MKNNRFPYVELLLAVSFALPLVLVVATNSFQTLA
jgi:hypothetical protein